MGVMEKNNFKKWNGYHNKHFFTKMPYKYPLKENVRFFYTEGHSS